MSRSSQAQRHLLGVGSVRPLSQRTELPLRRPELRLVPDDAPTLDAPLRSAVLHADQLRGLRGPEDPAETLALWRGLLDGRWSLVDQFDDGGRRYLVARRNHGAECLARALTLRERQVVGFVGLGQPNKLVAAALGLSASAVSTHLSAALRKLGLACRCELVALMAALALPVDGDDGTSS